MNKIEKAPKAATNTFVREIKGMSVSPATMKGQHVNAGVMFTSDGAGETLSVYDPSTKKQIVMPFEEVEQLIAHTRRGREGRP